MPDPTKPNLAAFLKARKAQMERAARDARLRAHPLGSMQPPAQPTAQDAMRKRQQTLAQLQREANR